MRWTERQRAMLREMGVRMWDREQAVAELAPQGDTVVAEREAPVERPRPVPGFTPVATPVVLSAPARAAEPHPRVEPHRAAEPVATHVDAVPAEWLIVGEPQEAAADAATPLAGDQERLLANMLHAVRVSRDAPARAGRACHVVLGAGGTAQIEQTLARVAPRVVLALGRVAAEALLGVDEPLGRLRGVVHERAGFKVVVTFALAYLLRHPTEKAKAWADLCLAARALEGDAT